MKLYRDTLAPTSEWFEKCARHTTKHTARTLQHIYLCDPCAEGLVREALNGRPFIYHGETVHGYCGLCNERSEVTLRQHFACIPCWALISSYQKGFVASQAVHKIWQRAIQPGHPELSLAETEPVRLEPYQRQAKSKREAAKTLTTLDFTASKAGVVLFHVELKSGPASIDEMKEFQLDVNDYEDIIGASCFTGIPTYIVHVQLRMVYDPPTRGVEAVGVWWTDFKTLRENLLAVRQRRGEDKDAAYFNRGAFQPIDTFSEEIATQRYLTLTPFLSAIDLALPER